MAAVSNLFIDAGSDYSTIITIFTPTGAVLNLASYTAKSQLRKSYSSSVAHTFTASIHDAVQGQIKLSLTAAQTEAIPPGRWLYDVEITHTSGTKKRVVEGIATITPQITQI